MDDITQIQSIIEMIGSTGSLIVMATISYNLYRSERERVREAQKERINELREVYERRIEDYKRWTDTLTSILAQREIVRGVPNAPAANP
jgi:hypothetical protein